MTILEAMETMHSLVDGAHFCSQPYRCEAKTNANDRSCPKCPWPEHCDGRLAVVAYNTIARALDTASNGCLERITLREDCEMVD